MSDYRLLSIEEETDWLAGHLVWPGAIETEEGVLVPLADAVVTCHFWNGSVRESETRPLAYWRNGMPCTNIAELMTNGSTKRGWSDFHIHHKDSPAPRGPWEQS